MPCTLLQLPVPRLLLSSTPSISCARLSPSEPKTAALLVLTPPPAQPPTPAAGETRTLPLKPLTEYSQPDSAHLDSTTSGWHRCLTWGLAVQPWHHISFFSLRCLLQKFFVLICSHSGLCFYISHTIPIPVHSFLTGSLAMHPHSLKTG